MKNGDLEIHFEGQELKSKFDQFREGFFQSRTQTTNSAGRIVKYQQFEEATDNHW